MNKGEYEAFIKEIKKLIKKKNYDMAIYKLKEKAFELEKDREENAIYLIDIYSLLSDIYKTKRDKIQENIYIEKVSELLEKTYDSGEEKQYISKQKFNLKNIVKNTMKAFLIILPILGLTIWFIYKDLKNSIEGINTKKEILTVDDIYTKKFPLKRPIWLNIKGYLTYYFQGVYFSKGRESFTLYYFLFLPTQKVAQNFKDLDFLIYLETLSPKEIGFQKRFQKGKPYKKVSINGYLYNIPNDTWERLKEITKGYKDPHFKKLIKEKKILIFEPSNLSPEEKIKDFINMSFFILFIGFFIAVLSGLYITYVKSRGYKT